MIIYPAIDMIDGKCVRLTQGKYDNVTIYGENPVEMAQRWEIEGAEFIHLVDLDGAKNGLSPNFEVVKSIVKSVKIPVQIGGGVRSKEIIEKYLSCGVNRVILGTKAVEDREFLKESINTYKEKIVVGIDAKDNMVAIHGWESVSGISAIDFAKDVFSVGGKTIIYTDIATDGMLSGPNISAMKAMADAVPIDIIASGGVSNLGDISALKKTNVTGVIIGKALYTNNLDLKQAIRIGRKV